MTASLCVHGHFYQPLRLNPFTGLVEHEPAAAPYHDFNEKVWAECYQPNAVAGSFARMSFDLGPTLATWLQTAHPATLRHVTAAGRQTHRLTGHSNAMAQAYHHTILPLATSWEKRLQIVWGVRDFRRRYGVAPEGLWLPETAVDEETLDLMAAQGITFTILAPWQARDAAVDSTVPYRVELAGGRAVSVFFYNAALSGAVSFNGDATVDAARFCTEHLAAQVHSATCARGAPQLLLIATDGELYGHHKAFRDLFLTHLLTVAAQAGGYSPVASLGQYLALHPPAQSVILRTGTSWSCAHGVARWAEGCVCTDGDAAWKSPLRRALRSLATRLDDLYEVETRPLLRDPWAALEDYLDLRDGAMAREMYWARHVLRRLRLAEKRRIIGLLEMQLARQAMFVSCAWFFDDLDRLEPRLALLQAHRAVTLAARHGRADLAAAFIAGLAMGRSQRTGRSAAEIYTACAESVTYRGGRPLRGLIGAPGLGYFKDRYAGEELQKVNASLYEQFKAEKPSQFLGFPSATGLDGKKLGAVKEAIQNEREKKGQASEEQHIVQEADIRGDRRTLRADSFIPAAMSAIYLGLLVYFASIGGYRPVHIEGKPDEPEPHTGLGLEAPTP